MVLEFETKQDLTKHDIWDIWVANHDKVWILMYFKIVSLGTVPVVRFSTM